ncbi:MAG: archease [Gemmatimonadota bacterium]
MREPTPSSVPVSPPPSAQVGAAPPSVRFEEHQGELRVTIEAGTLAELFGEATTVVSRACGPARGEPGGWEEVRLEAADDATLLVDWLNELIGRSEVEGRAYADVRVRELGGGRLTAEVRGCSVPVWESPIKAATYHGLALEQRAGRWRAGVLFDV